MRSKNKDDFKIKYLFNKQFYIYYFFKLKREKPWQYLFFDWISFLILSLFFAFGVVLFFPGKIKLSIPDVNSQVYILESVTRIVSVFVGISFSFVILSFNIFYRYFGRYAFLAFFKNENAKRCLTILVFTIGISIYGISYLKTIPKVDSYGNFIYFFVIGLSVTSFFLVFPSLFALLRSSQNRDNIISIFENLNENWSIDEFLARTDDKMSSFYHKDPISILTEIGTSAVKEFDNRTITVITSECSDFFKNSISDTAINNKSIEKRTLYREFTKILTSLFQLSVKERNEIASAMIIDARFNIEGDVLGLVCEKKDDEFADYNGKYRYWNLNFDVINFARKAIQFNEDDSCERIIDGYRDFAKQAFVKLFPKSFVYDEKNHFASYDDAQLLSEPLRAVNEIAMLLLASKKAGLIKSVFTMHFVLEQTIVELELPNLSKNFLLNIIFNYKYQLYELYIDSSDIRDLEYPFMFSVLVFEKTESSVLCLGSLQTAKLLFAKK